MDTRSRKLPIPRAKDKREEGCRLRAASSGETLRPALNRCSLDILKTARLRGSREFAESAVISGNYPATVEVSTLPARRFHLQIRTQELQYEVVVSRKQAPFARSTLRSSLAGARVRALPSADRSYGGRSKVSEAVSGSCRSQLNVSRDPWVCPVGIRLDVVRSGKYK